jgi:hypothetical protein
VTLRYGLALLLFLGTTAAACPFCDSQRAGEVRPGIVDGDLARTVLAIVLPFVLTFGVVAAVHFTGRRRRVTRP